MSDLISIIIPVFNVEKYLGDCLESIARQTYKNIEVILVDDGSTDLSGKICDNYEAVDERFKVIHKVNGGVASARNVGVEAAVGDYIGFVDPDDWIECDMYERMHKNIIMYDVDMVICAYYEIYDSKTTIKKFGEKGIVTSDIALKDILQNFSAYLWCRLYCRHVFDGIRFIAGRNFEDIEIMPRLIINSKTLYFDEHPVYYYQAKRPGSIVATKNNKNYEDFFWSYIDIMRNIRIKKPDFAGLAVKGVVIGYLAQYKRFADGGEVKGVLWEELFYYREVLLNELKGITIKNNLLFKERVELFIAIYCPRLFILSCIYYRKLKEYFFFLHRAVKD